MLTYHPLENIFVTSSYRKILESVALPALEGAKILLNTVVTSIHGKSTAPLTEKRVRLGIANSDQPLEFDEVVLTTPLGWLKKNLTAFHPRLPERLSQAIQNIGYGCLEKIYISFPEPFWLNPDEEGRTYTGFCQWLSPNYSSETNPNRWTKEVVELASVKEGGHPTLLFYTHGDESRYVTSSLRSMSREKGTEWLIGFFKPYYSRLPGFVEGDESCVPAAVVWTDWLGDDLAGNGSYANFQKGLREGDKDVEVMRLGVPEEGVWMAGEHTAPFLGLGTSTGAYWSGEGVARRVAGKVLGRDV